MSYPNRNICILLLSQHKLYTIWMISTKSLAHEKGPSGHLYCAQFIASLAHAHSKHKSKAFSNFEDPSLLNTHAKMGLSQFRLMQRNFAIIYVLNVSLLSIHYVYYVVLDFLKLCDFCCYGDGVNWSNKHVCWVKLQGKMGQVAISISCKRTWWLLFSI